MQTGGLVFATFAKLHTLADSVSQEVELGPPDDRVTLNDNLFDLGRVQGKLSLNPLACHNAADDEHFTRTRTALGDHRAGENLNALFNAFLNLRVHVHGISDLEGIHVFLEIRLFNGLKDLLAHDRRTLPMYFVLK